MNSFKEMGNQLMSKVEAIYMKAFAKAGLSLSDLGDADDETTLLIRDGLKLYAETKKYVSAYSELIDKQAEQIDAMQKKIELLEKAAENQQEKLSTIIIMLDKLQPPAGKACRVTETRKD